MSARALLSALSAVSLLMMTSCSHDATPRAVVQGGDGGGLPREPPAEEHLNANALNEAAADAATKDLQALIVLRHGHIVFDRYGHGLDATSEQDLGDFAQVLIALASGIGVQSDQYALPVTGGFDPGRLRDALQTDSHLTYADYLSQRLWRRLNAGPAWIAYRNGTPVPADCCFHARLLDWMRVADVLVEDGFFEGKQLVPKGWVARMRQPIAADGLRGFGVMLPAAAHGTEQFAADDVFFVRGPDRWRLYLVPSLKLAVLFGAADDRSGGAPWDETRVLNLILRGITDPPNPTDPNQAIKGLVPGH